MGSTGFATAGDGKQYTLRSKGYSADGQVWQVTVVCPRFDITGVANPNGVAVGTQNAIALWLSPGDSVTFLTKDLSTLCWKDASGAASDLAVFYELPAVYPVG